MKVTKKDIEKVWITKAGLKAVVLPNTRCGFRLGYVVLPKGKILNEGVCDTLDVHGGVTYTECVDYDTGFYPTFDENDVGKFVVGFDCGHLGDLSDPILCEKYNTSSYVTNFRTKGMGSVKSLEYVVNECEKLAKQIKGEIE